MSTDDAPTVFRRRENDRSTAQNATNIIQFRGIVIPSWLAVCLLLTAVLSALSLLLVWQSQIRIERELRILQVRCSDIENVLIRGGIATRKDFVTESRPKVKP